ncbi:IclR family transcriptional regulator [Chelatococcus asaccharovorans]|nr:IclR family transcriptional regulator [Chelatococcus asaccharovorans]MBS7703677.1 IclR family transcriptional regulator [Chelatococcus asaccharovorans]
MVLEKAIRLVDLVAEGVETLSALATASGMSRSTTHRLLATLVEHNYLLLEGKKYGLGYRLLELGEAKRRNLNFLDALRPVLNKYATLTNDTIHLAVLDGKDIVLLDRVFGDRQLRINSFPGLRNTAYMTAVGKVLIGNLPQKQWQTFIDKIPADYPRTAEDIMADFKNAQRNNVAIDIDECNFGTCGVASSFQVNDRLRVACSINGATVYFSNNRLQELGAVAKRMAIELRATLDGQMPNVEFDTKAVISAR